jgi:nucleotide-binding universal stress UspA family protein
VILLAVDGSDLALSAARTGIGLAKALGARVHVVHVVEFAAQPMAASAGLSAWAVMLPAARHQGESAVAAAAHEALTAKVGCTTQLVDAPDAASGIVTEALACGAGMIVVGSHGRTGVRRALLGSVAEKVLRHAECPVLVVR